MELRINFYNAFSFVFFLASLSFFWLVSIFLNEMLIFYLGIPSSLAIFFFFLQSLHSSNSKKMVGVTLRSPNLVLYIITTIAALTVLLVPPYAGSMLEWVKIPLIYWLRYIASLLLTTFLPGYFLLKILDRKGSISGSIIIVLSYLLSLFITFVAGFFILLSRNPIGSLGSPMVITINLALIILYHLTHQAKVESCLLAINWLEIGLTLSILAVVTVGSITVMVNNMPLSPGDMQIHHGLALQYSNGFPVYGGMLTTFPGGYLFHIYLVVLFALSGIPSAVAEQGLYVLSFVLVLALYSLTKVWFNRDEDRKTTSIATMLSILLGFGGLYALYLKLTEPTYNIIQLLGSTTSKTYDIYMRVLYLPDIVAPTWNIALPAFFALLYFLKKDACNITKTTIIPILVALGYLGHAIETFLFAIILFIYTLFLKGDDRKKIGPYIMLGLVIVALVDLAAPAQMYISFQSAAGVVLSLPFLGALFLATLTSIMELLKDRRLILPSLIKVKKLLLERLETSWRYSRWIFLYTYIFLFIVWLTIENSFNLWEWGGYSFTPFFVLPLRLGALGLLATIFISVHFTTIIQKRHLLFFLLFIPTGFVLEQVSNFYPSYYPAYRYATLTFIGVCIIAAYGVTMLMEKTVNFTSIKRTIVTCTLIFVLIISGLLSTTLYYVNAAYYSRYWEVPKEEADALGYICQHISTNSSVLTFIKESANRLRNFAGLNPAQDAQRWSNLLLSTTNPYVITYILSLSSVKYIYVAQRDVELVNSNNVLSSFVKYFPIVFENEYVRIYEVPPLTPPSSQASLGILHFSPFLQNLTDTMWIDDTFLRDWVLYGKHGNIHDWSAHSDGDVLKINVTSNQSGTVWISYSLPLTLKTKNSILSFRYKVNNDYTWLTIILQNASNSFFFSQGHLTDKTFTTKSYLLPDDQNVTRVEIIVETSDKAPPRASAIAEIDYIEISPSPFSRDDVFPSLFASLLHSKYSVLYVDALLMEKLGTYVSNYTHTMLTSDPQIPIEPLLNWVSAGNTLTVLNTDGNGFFAKLLELNNPSPLLSIKELGSGKIVYINCFSTIKTGNESELLQPDFLEEVKESLALDEYVHRVNILPVYNSTFGSIKINGDLNILTDIIRLQGSLNLTNSPFPFNKSAEIDIYGKVNLTIQNASLLVLPSESYMLIKPERYPVEGEVRVDSSEALIVADANVIHNHDMPISFKFKTTGLSLYARLPAINASGTITFEQLDVHVALYVPLAGIVQQRAEIQGNVKFDTIYISNQLTMFSMFQADGKILNLAETTSRPTIPWAQVLNSPYNLAFNTIFLSGIAIYTIKKRKAKTT